jgi:hypothetical protein
MAENKINVTELDFDGIKNNLVNYLSTQSSLKDYNFEGSALSTLVNVLAYNTHYNAIIANMLGNEMFLDSAVSKSSVISKAKELNYTPRSKSSSVAIVNIVVKNVPGNPNSLTIPKNTKFTSTINGKSYSFITNSQYVAPNVSDVFTFSNVKLYEGILSTASFVVGFDTKFFTIPSNSVDIDTVKVLVQNSSSDLNVTPYTKCIDITGVNNTDTVFFIQGYKESEYQVYFGDGIIGKSPVQGNIVIIEYIATNGSMANNAKVFNRFGSTTIGGSSNITITTISQSSGGKDSENIEDIKFNAMKSFTAQNRMVTVDDYKTLLKQNISTIKSISVWGGEDNNPPDYGSVYICIEPVSGGVYSDAEKYNIINYIINSKKIIGIKPKIVDPVYIYLKINSVLYYNTNKTSLSGDELSTIAYNTIKQYNSTYLDKFDGSFRYAALSKFIQECDPSVVSNITNISMHQYLIPTYGKPTSYTLDFYNPIYQNDFKTPENSFRCSRGFRIVGDSKTYFFEDDGNKFIKLFYYDGLNKVYANSNIGTIDYEKGRVKINTISISSIDLVSSTDIGLEIVAIPKSNDVIPLLNMIVKIKDGDIKTSSIPDPLSSGGNSSGSNYIFSESR